MQEKAAAPETAPVTIAQSIFSGPAALTPEEGKAAEQAFPVITAAPQRQEVMRPAEPAQRTCASALQLPVRRSLLKMVFLGLLTAGIYPTVIWSRIVTEVNITASRNDGKRTMPYFGMMMLAPFTLSISAIVWIHRFCNRVGGQLEFRKLGYRFGARDFWLWGVLGSLILVGPFVFIHKLMKSMNLINAHFNTNG